MSSQYKLTSANFVQPAGQDLIPETVLDINDPVYDIQKLAGINHTNKPNLQEYTTQSESKLEGSNCSKTAAEKSSYQTQHNVRPGTPEWFQLWFSKPYLTGEKPW